MAHIRPFRGVRYNPAHVGDLSAVVSQPYDRIGADLQARYAELSPYNVVRLIRGVEHPSDSDHDSIYTRARDTYHAWRQQGVLLREERPALYVLHQTSTLPDGSTRTRRGLVAALELTRFDEGIVLPHEHTLSGPKADRLALMRAIPVNFGHIFMLYSGGGLDQLLEAVTQAPPAIECRELAEYDVLQQVWVVSEPQQIARICEPLAPRRGLIIADGHHRYETALTFRDEMRHTHPEAPLNAAFNFVMVTLVSLEDPGLVILPTHRLVHGYEQASSATVLERARQFFDVRPVESRAALEAALAAADPEHPRFGLYNGGYAVLALREGQVLADLLSDRAPAWRMLDVTVLHELFIERVLGIDKGAVERNQYIEYLRDPQPGYEAVDRGAAQLLLLLNPTRHDQVQACVAAGERMPQKSTDFYPKVISGLVMMPVGAEERL